MTARKVKKPITFEVEGVGPFPFDMLRYDGCYPASSEDATAMGRSNPKIARRVRLTTLRGFLPDVNPANVGPTTARWLSFGWRVTGWPV
jgi:hypothetical protein